MKKAYKIFCLIIAVVAVATCFVVGGCDYSFQKAGKLTYVEWTDESDMICFRTVNGGIGNGYITLSGERIEAEFVFGIKSNVEVTVLTEDLSGQEASNAYDLSTEYFKATDLNGQGQIVSEEDNVTLFGQSFGRIVLTYTEINRDEVDAWEYLDDWSDDSGNLVLSATRAGYFSNKSRRAVANTSEGEKEVVFKWLPEDKKFAIFSYADDGEISDNLLAEGTYTSSAEEAVLTFTYDNLFGGAFTTLTIKVIK